MNSATAVLFRNLFAYIGVFSANQDGMNQVIWSFGALVVVLLVLVILLAADIRVRRSVEARLRTSEEQYRTTLESLADPMHVVDRRMRVVLYNKAFIDLAGDLGLSLDFGCDIFSVFPFLGDNVRAEYRKVFDTGETLITEESLSVSDRDFVTETRKIPVFRGKAVEQVITVVRDITGRKQAEQRLKASLAEKDALLHEIHHRVKNNMQIMTSLLSLQTRKIQDEALKETLTRCQGRIRSMALIYERLYQSEDLSKVEFESYARGLAQSICRMLDVSPARTRVNIDSDDSSLAVDAAVPCGLVLNELLTNSLTHAFPGESRKKNEVTIFFRRCSERMFEMSVADNGVGIPEGIEIESADSLGFQLVSTLVKDQLEGSLEVTRQGGTRVRITFGA